MNNREIATGVLKHPLIQEILKRKLVESSVVNRLIVEEIMLDEAEKNKEEKSIADITSAIATALDGVSLFLAASGYGMPAVPFIEAIGGAAGLTSAISYFLQGKTKEATVELIGLIPFAKIPAVNKVILKLLDPISKIGIKLAPAAASKLADIIVKNIIQRMTDRSKAVPQEAKQELVKYIPQAQMIPWEEVETAIAKTTSLTKPQGETHEQVFEEWKKFIPDQIIQTALGLLKDPNFAPFWEATKEYTPQDKLSAVRLEVMVAIFLAFLVSKISPTLEEELDPKALAAATGGQLTADIISQAFQMASDGFKKAETAGKPWMKEAHFTKFVNSQPFADAWIASMKLSKDSKEPDTTTDMPTDAAQLTTTPPVDTTTDTQLPALYTTQDVEKEKKETALITQQATDPQGLEVEFDKSDEGVPVLRYDDYITSLDKFFGMGESTDPSFMKVFFLRDQVNHLYNNLITPLENIINPSRATDEEDTEDIALNEEDVKVFQDPETKDVTVKRGEELKSYETGRRAAKQLQKGIIKTKKAAASAADRIAKLFSRKKEKAEPIPFPRKQKVSLKRELAALSDILIQTKKIANKYKDYGTSTSTDPQFDGSSLKKYLNALLDKTQTHTANIVYLLAELVRKAETSALKGSPDLQEQKDEMSRDEKIKIIRKVYNEMGQLYKRSLRTSLEQRPFNIAEMKKAQSAARNMLDDVKEIVPFFPQGIVHSQSGKIISLDDATKALNARIDEYKLILRDLYETTKDETIAEAHIGEMYESLKGTCKAIADNFDVPCKIRKSDNKVLEDTLGEPVQGLTNAPKPEEVEAKVEDQPEQSKSQDTKPAELYQVARQKQSAPANTGIQRVQEQLKPIIEKILRGHNG